MGELADDVVEGRRCSSCGRWLTAGDEAEKRRVIFLGDEMAKDIFGKDDPVGKTLLVNNSPFTVIGVMQHKTQMGVYGGPDATLDYGMSDVELPKFDAMTETIKGAGIAGELESVTIGHFQSMMVKLKWRAVRPATLALLAPVAQTFDIRGSIQLQESGAGVLVTSPLRVAVRGQVKSKNLGKLEPGKPLDAESDVEVAAISIYIDGARSWSSTSSTASSA